MDKPAAPAGPLAASGAERPGDGTVILTAASTFAHGAGTMIGRQADQAGALQATAASCANSIAWGAGTIQAAAYEQACRAAHTALRITRGLAEALPPEPGDTPLTTEQALRLVAAAREASSQLTTAARAAAAYATAGATSKLANHCADSAAALEHALLTASVAAQDLAGAAATVDAQ